MRSDVPGLRLFLYGVLELIKEQKKETCAFVEDNISKGIATVLYNKYTNTFNKCDFDSDKCKLIDEHFKTLIGVVDGKESTYFCEENDGIFLILKLALNEIY